MNTERILQIASELEALATTPEPTDFRFDMGVVLGQRHCGTAGCIAGWILHKHMDANVSGPYNEVRFGDGAVAFSTDAGKWLGLTPAATHALFFDFSKAWPSDATVCEIDDITPQAAALVLRNLAATGIVDWTIARPLVRAYDEGDAQAGELEPPHP